MPNFCNFLTLHIGGQLYDCNPKQRPMQTTTPQHAHAVLPHILPAMQQNPVVNDHNIKVQWLVQVSLLAEAETGGAAQMHHIGNRHSMTSSPSMHPA
jgi:hypothetical protein